MLEFEIYNAVLILAICLFQANWFAKNKPVGSWFHALWMLPFIVLWALSWFCEHLWWLILVLILERFVLFSPTLNIIRGKPFFYLAYGNDSGDAAKTDLLLQSIEPAYPYVWAVMATLLLVINIVKL